MKFEDYLSNKINPIIKEEYEFEKIKFDRKKVNCGFLKKIFTELIFLRKQIALKYSIELLFQEFFMYISFTNNVGYLNKTKFFLPFLILISYLLYPYMENKLTADPTDDYLAFYQIAFGLCGFIGFFNASETFLKKFYKKILKRELYELMIFYCMRNDINCNVVDEDYVYNASNIFKSFIKNSNKNIKQQLHYYKTKNLMNRFLGKFFSLLILIFIYFGYNKDIGIYSWLILIPVYLECILVYHGICTIPFYNEIEKAKIEFIKKDIYE